MKDVTQTGANVPLWVYNIPLIPLTVIMIVAIEAVAL